VVKYGRDADLLIHCVTLIPDDLLASNPAYRAIYEHLASPEDAARVFLEAKPKLAVFSHIGLNGKATQEDLISRTQRVYSGPVVVGHDLMAIDVLKPTDSTVK